MAFLRAGLIPDNALMVRGQGVWLRPHLMQDYVPWAELRAASRDHLTPWEPQWPRDELTRSAYRRRLRHYQREQREDLGYAFLILREGDDQLLGGMTLSNVRRGVTQAAALGYWLGVGHTHQGRMTQAVRAIIPFAFHELHLHRLEAACMPANIASIRVLERCGFEREGYARRYLRINGVWEDHILYARIADQASAARAGSW